MNRNTNLSVVLLNLVFTFPCISQVEHYNSLDEGIDNPAITSISFFPEDEKVGEFISRSAQFDQLNRIQIKRYTNSQQSKLMLATVSTYDSLHLLHLEVTDFSFIPPYLDRFKGLRTLQISPVHSTHYREDPMRLLVRNGNDNLFIELNMDKETALDYMDRFFVVYPLMVQTVLDFTFYPLRAGLQKVEKKHNSFNPILLPKSSSTRISPVQQSRIVTLEGSTLTIPPYAFVDQNMNPVTDSVQVDFTYFRDQLDIALSRIGMTTDVNGEPELLQSAGMFEITASRNGALLQLAENKTIEVEMVSSDGGAYDVYVFDDNNNDWDVVETENLPIKGTTVLTPAYYKYNEFFIELSKTRTPAKADLESADLFASNEYIRFEKRTNSHWDNFDLSNPGQTNDLIKTYKRSAKDPRSKLPFIILERLSPLHSSLRGHYFFSIDDPNQAIPEIRHLGKYSWYTADLMGSDEFRKRFVQNKTYVDTRLSYDALAETFEFVFKDVAGQFDTLSALPFLESKKQQESKAMAHQNILTLYQDAFAEVAKKTYRNNAAQEKKYTRDFLTRMERQSQQEERAWENVKSLMTPAEEEMSFEQWNVYFDNLRGLEQQVLLAQNTARETLTRTIFLDEMGYWNVDKPILKRERFEDVKVLADHADNQDYQVSVLFFDFNSALTTGRRSKTDQIGDCAYLLMDADKISWITPGESKKIKNGKLETKNPFIEIANVDVDKLRAELFAD